MAYPLELLARQNCKRIHVSLYQSAGFIEAFFGSGSRWGVHLEYLLQPEDWGSAGSIRWAKQHLTEPFVVLPSDMICDIDLVSIFQQHIAGKNIATIVMTPRKPSTSAQSTTRNNADGEEYVETGIFVLDPQVIEHIPTRSFFEISSHLIPALVAAGLAVNRVVTREYWNPLSTFAEYQEAQKTVLESALTQQEPLNRVPFLRFPGVQGRKIREGVWVGHNSSIHPLARLTPPILVANNCLIGKGVDLGPYAVIGNNVIIDEDATIANTTVLDNSYIGHLVNLENRIVSKNILIDANSGEAVDVPDPHLLTQTYRVFDDSGVGRLIDIISALFYFVATFPITLIAGILLLVTTGSIFRWYPRIHMAPSKPGLAQEHEFKSFKLLRFATRDRNGRPTLMGKVLEKWDLHRLPELLNIIRGDIRFIGVKPLSPEENSLVKEPWQKTRYAVSPGFTGLWYVQTLSTSDFDEVLVSDAYYAATRTWTGDIKLVFQTIRTWFRRLK